MIPMCKINFTNLGLKTASVSKLLTYYLQNIIISDWDIPIRTRHIAMLMIDVKHVASFPVKA